MAIISTIAPVMKEILNRIKLIDPLVTLVYSPDLSFEKGVATVRINEVDSTAKPLPLIAYNRSTLKQSTELGRRGVHTGLLRPVIEVPTVKSYQVANCEFDFKFMYISKSMSEIENFEINFCSDTGLTSLREIKLDLIELGIWTYYLWWTYPLDDFTTNIDGNTYKSIGGSVTVKGWYLTADVDVKLITDIYTSIYDTHRSIYNPDSSVLIRQIHTK